MDSELVVQLGGDARSRRSAGHGDVHVDVRLAMRSGSRGGGGVRRRPGGRTLLRVDHGRRREAVTTGRRRRARRRQNRRRLASSQHTAEHLMTEQAENDNRMNHQRQSIEETVGQWFAICGDVWWLIDYTGRRLATVDLVHLKMTGAWKTVDGRRQQSILTSNFSFRVLQHRRSIQ